MTCDELRDNYDAFALGIAEEPELSEIASHLARRCPQCDPGVKQAMATVSALSGAVKPSDPPKRLRRRVASLVDRKGSRLWANGILPWSVALLLSVVVLSIALPARKQAVDMARLDEALSILNDPTAKEVSFGEAKPSKGRVVVSPGKGVLFLAARLPKLEAGKTFELWIIPKGGKPVAAGTFEGREDSTAVYVHPGPVLNASAVAVTVEPEGGSQQPTTIPFIVTTL